MSEQEFNTEKAKLDLEARRRATKPGYKTTEFWLTLVYALLSSLVVSGVIPSESEGFKFAVAITEMLAILGYGMGRTFSKRRW